MATKASKFRYAEERSGPDRPKKQRAPKQKPPRDEIAEPMQADVPAKNRKAAGGSTADRNRSLHAARKGGVKLEDSQTKPSRKASRGSKGHTVTTSFNKEGVESKRKGEGKVKPASNLRIRATARTRSPAQRAQRGNPPARGGAPSR